MILAVFFPIVAAQKHADCRLPEAGVEGKVLGLHSTVFLESDIGNTRLNNKNQSKKAVKRPQLRKLG